MQNLLNLQYAQRLLLQDKQQSRIRAMQTITTRVQMMFREGKSDDAFIKLIHEIKKIEVDFINVSAALYRRTGLFMLRSMIRGIPVSFFNLPQTTQASVLTTSLSSNLCCQQFMQKCVPIFLNSIGDLEAKVRLAAVEGCYELLRRSKIFVIRLFFFELLCALSNSIHDRDRQVASLANDVSSVMRQLIRSDVFFVIDNIAFTKFVVTVLEPFIYRHNKTIEEECVINWVLDWIFFVLDLPNTNFIRNLPSYLSLLLQLFNTCNNNFVCDINTYDSSSVNYKNYSSPTVAIDAADDNNNNIVTDENKMTNIPTDGSSSKQVRRTVNAVSDCSTHMSSTSGGTRNIQCTNLLQKILKQCRAQTRKIILKQKQRQAQQKNAKVEQVVHSNQDAILKDMSAESETRSENNFNVQAVLSIFIRTISKTKYVHTLQVCIEWIHELCLITSSSLLQLLPDLVVKCVLPLQDIHNLTIKNAVTQLQNTLKCLINQRSIEVTNVLASNLASVHKSDDNATTGDELLQQIALAIIRSMSGTLFSQSKYDNDIQNTPNNDKVVYQHVGLKENNNDNSFVAISHNNENQTNFHHDNQNVHTAVFSCNKSEAYLVRALQWLNFLHSCHPSPMQRLTLSLYKHTMHLLANISQKVMDVYVTVLCEWSGIEMFDACLQNVFQYLCGNMQATSLLLSRLPFIMKRLHLFYEDAFATQQFPCTRVMCKFAQMLSQSQCLYDMRWRCKFVITCQTLLLTADEFANMRQLLRQCQESNTSNSSAMRYSRSNMNKNNQDNDKLCSQSDIVPTVNVKHSFSKKDKDCMDLRYRQAHKVFDVLFKS